MEEVLFFFFPLFGQCSSFLFFLAERVFYLFKKKKKVQELQKSSLSDLCLVSKCNICVYT